MKNMKEHFEALNLGHLFDEEMQSRIDYYSKTRPNFICWLGFHRKRDSDLPWFNGFYCARCNEFYGKLKPGWEWPAGYNIPKNLKMDVK